MNGKPNGKLDRQANGKSPRRTATPSNGLPTARAIITAISTRTTNSIVPDDDLPDETLIAAIEVDDELEHLPEDGSPESHIDDPIRMYLMQMGEIPMLNRERRNLLGHAASKKPAPASAALLLANDFVLHGAVELLEKVQNGELRLDRTIEISVTNTAEKKRTLKRIAPNLATIKHLLRLNQVDFRIAVEQAPQPQAEKHSAWRRLVVRRNKIVRLVEELNLRHRQADADHAAAPQDRRADGHDQAAARRAGKAHQRQAARRAACTSSAT